MKRHIDLSKSVQRLQSWIKEAMIAHNNRAVELGVYQKKRTDGKQAAQ